MQRREVLLSLAGGLLWACSRSGPGDENGMVTILPASTGSKATSSAATTAAVSIDCVELMLDTEGRTLGRTYAKGHPDEANPARLRALITGGKPCDLETLRAAIADDYAQARVVELHGWVISVTEGRMLALASL